MSESGREILVPAKAGPRPHSFPPVASHNLMYPIYLSSGGTSLAVQWLRIRASTAGGAGSIPGQGTKIPRATEHSQKRKKKKNSKKIWNCANSAVSFLLIIQ